MAAVSIAIDVPSAVGISNVSGVPALLASLLLASLLLLVYLLLLTILIFLVILVLQFCRLCSYYSTKTNLGNHSNLTPTIGLEFISLIGLSICQQSGPEKIVNFPV